ncbi:MAG TPA: hypothetical protein VNE63_00260 [Candidatus Acidoferrales bacterium]|nr:hypothetical protein [Candidatus Acidoferrales bacterium]
MKKQMSNARRAALVRQARAGLIPASDDMANEKRARMNRTARVARTVKAYERLHICGSKDLAITHILADLRHYCDCKGLAFHRFQTAAYALYSEEKADEFS